MIIRNKSRQRTKERVLSLAGWIAKAQKEFNTFIRRRDQDKGCISCGARVTEAGHYLSAGHNTSMRFSEINTNGQCTRCNCFLHGNLIDYRQGLIKRYGEQKVLLLESQARQVKRWSRGELQIIYQTYKELNEQ